MANTWRAAKGKPVSATGFAAHCGHAHHAPAPFRGTDLRARRRDNVAAHHPSAASPANAKNPVAIAEVQAGKRPAANAAWWGFDDEDATDALQAAIRSGAKKVIVPNLGKDWIVRPIQLVSDQELFSSIGVTFFQDILSGSVTHHSGLSVTYHSGSHRRLHLAGQSTVASDRLAVDPQFASDPALRPATAA